MNDSRVEGAYQSIAGKVEDNVGGLTGDPRPQVEGKARHVAGKVQGACSDAANLANDLAAAVNQSVEQQPLTALLIAAVVGCMLGWFMHRRS